MQVSLFTTCLTDGFFPQGAVALVRLLKHLGCAVDCPATQTCCGQGQFNNGLHHQARRLGANLIDVFEHSCHVVSPSASCTAMIREYYPQLFVDDPVYLPKAQALAAKTFEITEFLSGNLNLNANLPDLKPRHYGKVTYHYSCHSRGIGLSAEATISLIKMIEGIEYIPLEKMDQCCGFGGTFAVKASQVSEALVRDKVDSIVATGADTVVVNDGGCTLNIAGHCHRRGLPIRFVHIAGLLAESLGLMGHAGEALPCRR